MLLNNNKQGILNINWKHTVIVSTTVPGGAFSITLALYSDFSNRGGLSFVSRMFTVTVPVPESWGFVKASFATT